MTTANIDQLWSRHWQGDATAKRALIEAYLPLVKRVVGRLAINLPGFVDRGDLEGAAVLGLIEAIGAFREERGVRFETYAVARIRGAALDNLRQLDFVPRSVRRKARLLQEVLHSLHSRLGRQPEPAEIAQELGIPQAELDRWWQDVQAVTVLSLDAPLDSNEDADSRLELLPAPEDSNPAALLAAEAEVQELTQAISQLTTREQQLLSLYYVEGLTLKELGKVLGVTESRACQLHTAAILKLRARLTPGEGKQGAKRRTS